ncbi:MAG: S8/S53 family peptidase [Bacteroidota bacterium]
MKKLSFTFLMLFIVTAHHADAKARPDQKEYRIAPGEIVVKIKRNIHSVRRINTSTASINIQSAFQLSAPMQLFPAEERRSKIAAEELEGIVVYSVSSATDVEALAKKISGHPDVEYAEPHYYFRTHVIPNDPLYSQIYPLGIVKADSAWFYQKGDSSVVIGIIDSGVDWDHPDLSSVIWRNSDEIPDNGIDDDGNGYIDDIRGWDFVANVGDAAAGEDGLNEDNNPMDFDGHGTHVSGIAAGATNNAIGISSLSWGCRIMPLRSGWHSSDGNGYVSSVYASKAYVYAADNGASVCNQSSGTSNVVLDGARYAYKNGVVIVNSAGNSNTDFAASLGSEPWALSVAATNSSDGKASYSSFNDRVDISAPGGDFNSANRKGFLSSVVNPSAFFGNSLYVEFQGTSMAAPFVASLAALVKSKYKEWSPAQIMFHLTGTSDNIDALNPQYAGKLGYGRMNALRAMTETPSDPKPDIEFVGYSVSDGSGGNNNGIPEAGEALGVSITVKNNWGDANTVTATLSSPHWAASITKPNASYGIVPGISNLDSNQRSNSGDEFMVTINANAVPEAIPFTFALSAANGYSKEFYFEISIGARILLVDDDDGTVNVEQYYTSALRTLGASYDVWNHNVKGTPSLAILQQYSAVFWSCEWAFPSLDSADRSVLAAYLTGGGKLFLSGQDIGWDLASGDGLEYELSAGASKTFFEQYLKATFVHDDALTGNITGKQNDTIGTNLSFNRYQPFRASGEQYPDVLTPLGGSVVSFQYADGSQSGKGASILYSGDYKLLYFGFGGFESIVDSSVRITVMDRILKWMFEYSITTDRLSNTENTAAAYPVKSVIASKSSLQSVDLLWNANGTYPYNKVSMNLVGDSYSASIPAQPANSTVRYFVLAKSANGYLPFTQSSFFVGVDTIKPVVAAEDTIKNSIRVNGPYTISVFTSDDIGIDTTSAVIRYRVNGGEEHLSAMVHTGNNAFIGSIIPATALASGDRMTYYVSVNDVSQLHNSGRYPVNGEREFFVGREIVDDFENPSSGKWNVGLWGHTNKQKFRGVYSLTDSPDSSYAPNSERSVTLISGYDLTPFISAQMTFHQRYNIHNSDTAYIEVSNNGSEWQVVRKFTGVNLFWKKETINLHTLTGSPWSDLLIRMRMKSDDSTQSDGIYIDEMEIVTDHFVTPLMNTADGPPASYSLSQNFPNPFNPVTTIRFTVPHSAHVTVKVYDLLGREVATLINEVVGAGLFSRQFNGSQLSSGVYYYRLQSGSYTAMRKMVFIK